MVKIWLRGEVISSYLAGLLASLLIIPHVVWYDWAILIGVAPFALYKDRSPWLLCLMLGLHLTASRDSLFIVNGNAYMPSFFASTLFATGILVYLGFAPQAATQPSTEATVESSAEPLVTLLPVVPAVSSEPDVPSAQPPPVGPETAAEPAGS
jgi:hypothetical protein